MDYVEPITDVIIYAHSHNTLYSFSPQQNMVISAIQLQLPDESPAPSMVDLAVNKDNEIYTSGYDDLFRVDPETGRATPIGELHTSDGQSLSADLGVHLYALTFIPASLFPGAEPFTEVLIGASNEGTCYEVDPQNAEVRYIGQYPSPWGSSGDLVSVERAGTTFATLKNKDSDDQEPDYLAEVEFLANGQIAISDPRPIQNDERAFIQIFGLGYWGRSLYGFTDDGELIDIDRETAEGELATQDTGAEEFWGAGVTTQTPVLI